MIQLLGKRLSLVVGGVLLTLIRFYQLAISPLMANHCRFEPTCSRYAITALRLHGPWRGLILAVRRVLRCRPGVVGGVDTVPNVFPCSCRVKHED